MNRKTKFRFEILIQQNRKIRDDISMLYTTNIIWRNHNNNKRKRYTILLVQLERMEKWLLFFWAIRRWHFSYGGRNSATLCGILTASLPNHLRIDSSIPVVGGVRRYKKKIKWNVLCFPFFFPLLVRNSPRDIYGDGWDRSSAYPAISICCPPPGRLLLRRRWNW